VDGADLFEDGGVGLVGAEGVAGADGVAVDARAVEAGDVEGGVDPFGEDAPPRLVEGDRFGGGREIEAFDGLAGLRGRAEVTELLATAHADHSQSSTATVSPASYPSRPSGTTTQPSARATLERTPDPLARVGSAV